MNSILENTVLPVIAAPMFLISGPALVIACCRAGVIGSFPAPNARTIDVLDEWMDTITRELRGTSLAAWAFNMIVHSSYQRLPQELELVKKYQPPIVITALGSPKAVLNDVHSYGGLVLADVNSVTLAQKAAQAGVDGLVLVSSGAGGHTGSISPFAFVDEVRQFWDGVLVLAGSISTGRAIWAAQILGADLAYIGTRFIATEESLAQDEYKQMLVQSTVTDIKMTDSFTGVNANMLIPSIRRKGLDPDNLKRSGENINFNNPQAEAKAWKEIWSAGHGVGMVKAVQPVAELIADLCREYHEVSTK